MKFNFKNTLGSLILFGTIALSLVSCKKDEREKFLGTYSVNESCGLGNVSYQMTVSASSSSDDGVLMANFGGFSTAVSVSGNINKSAITIPNQNISIGGNTVSLSGTGALNGTILTIAYTFSVGGGSDNCTATCTKL